jgi:ABC-type antimicrobial peptide transport system permease subunit
VLRALGYRPRRVLTGLLVETMVTATTGALVGIGAGLLMGLIVVRALVGGANIRVDTAFLAWAVGLMYLAALAVTIGPVLRAARLPIVAALRVED